MSAENNPNKKTSLLGLALLAILIASAIIIPLNFLASFYDENYVKEREANEQKRKSPWIIEELKIEKNSDIYSINEKHGSPDFSIPKPKLYMGKPVIQCIYNKNDIRFYLFNYKGMAYAGKLIDKETYDNLLTESLSY